MAHHGVHILDKHLHGFVQSEFGLSGIPDVVCIELGGGGVCSWMHKLPMLY